MKKTILAFMFLGTAASANVCAHIPGSALLEGTAQIDGTGNCPSTIVIGSVCLGGVSSSTKSYLQKIVRHHGDPDVGVCVRYNMDWGRTATFLGFPRYKAH